MPPHGVESVTNPIPGAYVGGQFPLDEIVARAMEAPSL